MFLLFGTAIDTFLMRDLFVDGFFQRMEKYLRRGYTTIAGYQKIIAELINVSSILLPKKTPNFGFGNDIDVQEVIFLRSVHEKTRKTILISHVHEYFWLSLIFVVAFTPPFLLGKCTGYTFVLLCSHASHYLLLLVMLKSEKIPLKYVLYLHTVIFVLSFHQMTETTGGANSIIFPLSTCLSVTFVWLPQNSIFFIFLTQFVSYASLMYKSDLAWIQSHPPVIPYCDEVILLVLLFQCVVFRISYGGLKQMLSEQIAPLFSLEIQKMREKHAYLAEIIPTYIPSPSSCSPNSLNRQN